MVAEVIEESPDYVGVTAVSISIFNASRLTIMIKEANPGIGVIIGGAQLTSSPVKSMEMFPCFDIGVVGEGEATTVELLVALQSGRELEDVKGLVIRKGGKIVVTRKRPFIRNLDKLAFPAWDLLPDLGKTYCPPVHTVKRLPATLLVTTRGCPGKCTFCDRSVFGRICRTFSSDYVIDMIQHIRLNYGIREIQFRDDNLLAYRKQLREICEKLIRLGLNITWSCVGRVDMVKPEDLKIMKEAGCWSISYGIESGSQRILDEIKKEITKEQIINAVTLTRNAGIEAVGFFMAGHPLESKETMRETMQLLRELPLNGFHMTFFTPHPGSENYERIEEYGVLEDDWSKMSEWYPIFIPYGLTRHQLVMYWKKAIRSFYFRPQIILQYITKIHSFAHLEIYFRGFLAFIEALIRKR